MLTRKQFSIAAFAVCFLSASATPRAADKPTESDVQETALKAAELVKAKDIEAARSVFNADGEFKHGEIYVNVISDKGIRLIYPPAPTVFNVDVLEAQDVEGKFLIKDILEVAKTKGEGWAQYRWTNPTTKKIAEKMTYVKSVPERGVVVYVGMYK